MGSGVVGQGTEDCMGRRQHGQRSLISDETWGEGREPGQGDKDIHCPATPEHYLFH